jgi:hypothetical protein
MKKLNLRGPAQEQVAVIEKTMKPLGFKQINNMTVARTLAEGGAIPPGAVYALLMADTQNVRWRDDGLAPTSTSGMLLRTSDAPYLYQGDLDAIQLIQVAATAVLNVAFYGDHSD